MCEHRSLLSPNRTTTLQIECSNTTLIPLCQHTVANADSHNTTWKHELASFRLVLDPPKDLIQVKGSQSPLTPAPHNLKNKNEEAMWHQSPFSFVMSNSPPTTTKVLDDTQICTLQAVLAGAATCEAWMSCLWRWQLSCERGNGFACIVSMNISVGSIVDLQQQTQSTPYQCCLQPVRLAVGHGTFGYSPPSHVWKSNSSSTK